MDMFNVTEIRQNASKIISHVIKTKEPVMVLQRSKPVVYIIEANAFEELQKKVMKAEQYEKMEATKKALNQLSRLRNQMKLQPDSTPLIRQLREGDGENE
ncbi:type II toxin-antitoxin system Phd/YefM family antitoxin [Desulforamulus putei]|uniref:Antitoxin n=1 Tax=Desulforamulus putei DSM 12395 TaxID=1121429 RepID=A0A1M4YGJ5_9FIRM|nr:type II toxin-antitoxin system Phd/YefM family antitoxin [Desulforamulus putei]SHF04934.1 prevent-host-death family protein [Desulforamulus putei DSM 12395]